MSTARHPFAGSSAHITGLVVQVSTTSEGETADTQEAVRSLTARLTAAEAARIADAERAAEVARVSDALKTEADARILVAEALARDAPSESAAQVRDAELRRQAEAARVAEQETEISALCTKARTLVAEVRRGAEARMRLLQAEHEEGEVLAAAGAARVAEMNRRTARIAEERAAEAVHFANEMRAAEAARVVAALHVEFTARDDARVAAETVSARAASGGAGMSTRRSPRPAWNTLWYCKPN